MAATETYYGKHMSAQCTKDPTYFPIMWGSPQIQVSANAVSSGINGTSGNFWSALAKIGTYSQSLNSGYITTLDISNSNNPIACSFIIGPYPSSTTTNYFRFTVDGTETVINGNVTSGNRMCWGNFDYFQKSATDYTGFGFRYGGDLYQATGDIQSQGFMYNSYSVPMSVHEAMNRGCTVLVAEHSLKVEVNATAYNAYPHYYKYRGVGWGYLG